MFNLDKLKVRYGAQLQRNKILKVTPMLYQAIIKKVSQVYHLQIQSQIQAILHLQILIKFSLARHLKALEAQNGQLNQITPYRRQIRKTLWETYNRINQKVIQLEILMQVCKHKINLNKMPLHWLIMKSMNSWDLSNQKSIRKSLQKMGLKISRQYLNSMMSMQNKWEYPQDIS